MSNDQKIMDKFVELSQEILVLKASNRALNSEIERCKEIAERDGADYSKIAYKLKKILEVCKGYEDKMWSAKIISIILDCDFRDAKQKIQELEAKNEKS